jgi:hypothetical protein
VAPDVYEAQLAANRAAIRATRARLAAYVSGIWFGLGSWMVGDVERFIDRILPAVTAAQRTTAVLTDQQIALIIARHLGTSPRPLGLALELLAGAPLRNGTPPELVYRRGGAEVWDALGKGEPLEVAVQRGATRIERNLGSDLQLAKTHAAREVIKATPGAFGFKRVLVGDKSCGLCALAATQRYNREDLLPIHPACDCDVEPLLEPTEQVIDEAALSRIHELAAEFFGHDGTRGDSAGSHAEARTYDFRDFVVVHEHGEYGPVLARKGDHFEAPAA